MKIMDKIFHLLIFKSLAVPMIKMTHMPLILLTLIWSLPVDAEFCEYEDVPNLADTIEVSPPPLLGHLLGMTKEEVEARLNEYEAGMKKFEESRNHRSLLNISFIVWKKIDCNRQLNILRDKKEELEILGLDPPYGAGDAGDIILDKAVDMAYAGSGVEEIQKMAQKSFREFLNRENRGERIHWQY